MSLRKLQTENHLEFLSLKGGCTGSSESSSSKCHIVGNHMSRLSYVDQTSEMKISSSDHYVRMFLLGNKTNSHLDSPIKDREYINTSK